MQGKRTRARDSRGREVRGIYIRDGVYSAGFQCPQTGRWRNPNLSAKTLTAARREREKLLADLREGRTAAPAAATFRDVFAEHQAARNLSSRTLAHEQHLLTRHLSTMADRRVQAITTSDVAKVLHGMRDRPYAEWTRLAVYRIMRGTLALAVRRGIITRSPVDGLAPSEVPKQRNKREIARLDMDTLARFVDAGTTERWRAALALGTFGGLRLGEIRALRWSEADFDAGAVVVNHSMLPDGTIKAPKTAAGRRAVPMLPALRRALAEWKLRSPHTQPDAYVICTTDGKPVQERNVRRAFAAAQEAASIETKDERFSMHALRHSNGSALATNLALPATTLARVMGHTDPGFTLRVYARDRRDDATVVSEVLARAEGAGIGA